MSRFQGIWQSVSHNLFFTFASIYEKQWKISKSKVICHIELISKKSVTSGTSLSLGFTGCKKWHRRSLVGRFLSAQPSQFLAVPVVYISGALIQGMYKGPLWNAKLGKVLKMLSMNLQVVMLSPKHLSLPLFFVVTHCLILGIL